MTDKSDSRPHRTALITGASAGIGQDIARVFAEHSFNVVLVARRRERLEALAEEIRSRHGVKAHVVEADLADPATPRRLFDEMASRHIVVDALVNNAGYGVMGLYRDTKWEAQRDLLQVMVTAVAELCHLFGPGMAARGYGRIINVASLAGFLPGTAGGTLYTPAKSFAIKLSEALAAEYAPHNVHVTALCPGFTYSEFHDVAGVREQMSKLPRFLWMDSRRVAVEAFEAVMAGRPIWINGRRNRLIAWAARHLPAALIRSLSARRSRTYSASASSRAP